MSRRVAPLLASALAAVVVAVLGSATSWSDDTRLLVVAVVGLLLVLFGTPFALLPPRRSVRVREEHAVSIEAERIAARTIQAREERDVWNMNPYRELVRAFPVPRAAYLLDDGDPLGDVLIVGHGHSSSVTMMRLAEDSRGRPVVVTVPSPPPGFTMSPTPRALGTSQDLADASAAC